MNIRYGILLTLALVAAASLAFAGEAKTCKSSCASAVAVCAEGGEKQIRVEVEETDGKSLVKVYELKDGEEVLIKEYEGEGGAHEILELDDDANVFIMRAHGDGEGMTWHHGGGDHDAIRKIMKVRSPKAMFVHQGGGYMGVMLEDLNDGLAEYFEVDEGVLVKEVIEDTPAAEAGLRAGDVIVKVGDENVAGADDVVAYTGSKEPGDEVEVKVVRKGDKKTFKVTLAEREMEDFAFAMPDGDFEFHGMPHMEHFDHGEHEMIIRRLHEGSMSDMDELKAEMEELRAMLEELKKDK